MMQAMKSLSPQEELARLRACYESDARVLDVVRDMFNVLHTRAQVVLGLVTICLTITGFSGPKIAESGPMARGFVSLGVVSVLVCAALLAAGPMRLRWLTRQEAATWDATLCDMLVRRNRRTALYHAALGALLVGLSGYVLSLAAYLAAG